MGLIVAETEVFSGNSPNPSAWTDLDINGVVGANHSFVIFKVYGTSTMNVIFRLNGETEVAFSYQSIFRSLLAGSGRYIYCAGITDSAGIVEWKYSVANDPVTIDVVAYRN